MLFFHRALGLHFLNHPLIPGSQGSLYLILCLLGLFILKKIFRKIAKSSQLPALIRTSGSAKSKKSFRIQHFLSSLNSCKTVVSPSVQVASPCNGCPSFSNRNFHFEPSIRIFPFYHRLNIWNNFLWQDAGWFAWVRDRFPTIFYYSHTSTPFVFTILPLLHALGSVVEPWTSWGIQTWLHCPLHFLYSQDCIVCHAHCHTCLSTLGPSGVMSSVWFVYIRMGFQ